LKVLAAVSAIFLFGGAATFSTLGVALFAMQADFHWSDAQAGGGFLALGLSCCLLSMLPVALLPRIGGRWTCVAGCLAFCAGFLVAAATQNLVTIYAATVIFGLGYSLVANTAGIFLLAGWFGDRAPRVIGVYLTVGTLGGALGPPLVQWLIAAGGWRLYWLVMAAIAVALAVLCAVAIREPSLGATESEIGNAATFPSARAALSSSHFVVIAFAMLTTQLCILTVSGIAPAHLAALRWPPEAAARFLGAQGLIGTIGTAGAGWFADRLHPRTMQAASLVALAIGVALLACATSLAVLAAAAIAFGLGWSVACVAVTLYLIRLFGPRSGSTALSAIWTLSGLATAGPWAIGLWADHGGGFRQPLVTLAVLPLLLVPATLSLSESRKEAAYFDKKNQNTFTS
jgi:MFS family permease